MNGEYVTRSEHQEAVRRLDEADSQIRTAISNTERVLRQDYETKIGEAVATLGADISELKSDLKGDLGEVKTHLTEQDSVLTVIRTQVEGNTWFQRAAVGVLAILATGVVTFIAYYLTAHP